MTTPIPTLPLSNRASINPEELQAERNIWRITGVLSLSCLVFTISLVGLAFIRSQPLPLIAAAVTLISFIVIFLLRNQNLTNNTNLRLLLAAGLFHFATISFNLIYSDVSLQSATVIMLVSLMVASSGLKDNRVDTAIGMGIGATILISLIGLQSPFARLNEPYAVYGITAYTLLLGLAYLTMHLGERISSSLRIKIILPSLAMVILPLVLLNFIDTRFLRSSIQEQTNQSLMNGAATLARDIDTFFIANRSATSMQALLKPYADFMDTPSAFRYGSNEEKQVIAAVESFKSGLNVKDRAYLASVALLDMEGKVVFSSNEAEIDRIEGDRVYFTRPAIRGIAYYSPVEFLTNDKVPLLTFSDLIRGQQGRALGVIRIQFEATVLQRMANDAMRATGNTAFPIILDENFIRLADPVNTASIYSPLRQFSPEILQKIMAEHRLPEGAAIKPTAHETEFAGYLENSAEQPFFELHLGTDNVLDTVAATQTDSFPWYVAFMQDQSSLLLLIQQQNGLSNAIATLIAGLISLGAMFFSRTINSPVVELTSAAQRISLGNLDVTNSVRSKDELGILGRTINTMAAQLKQLISGLEDRVRERTYELAQQNESLRFRSRQMETIAEVARGVTTAQDLETLLSNITHMVSDRFNFYHVGVFLIDERGEYAVLRAANSTGGQRMLARQHRLQVGQTGIVGFVTAQGKARIATDVGKDATFFNNPDLPATRSEMALPLKIGEEIIGALDVQSTTSDAFTEDDIQLFGILADQIAVAIYNNRLYTDTTLALNEARVLHRRYLEQEWERESDEISHPGYIFTAQGISAISGLDASDIQTVFDQGELVRWSSTEDNYTTGLTVPVKLRGETIGVIRLQEHGNREWLSEDAEAVQAVADQVALALENARLFSQTRRKAERERRVLDITSKIRSTNDPRAMMQIAIEELQRSLNASRVQVILQSQQVERTSGTNGNGKDHA